MGRAEFQLSNKQTYAFNSCMVHEDGCMVHEDGCMVHEDVTSMQTRHRVGVILLDTDMISQLNRESLATGHQPVSRRRQVVS